LVQKEGGHETDKDEAFRVSLVEQAKLDEIAARRVEKLRLELESEGLVVLTNANFASGVDLIAITKKGKLKMVAEVTNYANKGEWIGKDRSGKPKMDRYIESLSWFDRFPNVEKRLYVSFKENLRSKDTTVDEMVERLEKKNNINIVIVGEQD
jgi:hypothetical protein